MSEYCDHFDVLFSDVDDHFIGFRESQAGGGVGAGYYVPAVSESGILSWTPSDPSMPDVTPRNVKGQAGAPGNDGVSPEVTVETISGGHRVTITDADHPEGQGFNVMDGEGAVSSVNGMSGAVVLDAEDVGALPTDTTIPTALSQLFDDTTHRTVNDTEKATWNAKQDAIGYTPANDTEVVKKTDTISIAHGGTGATTAAAARAALNVSGYTRPDSSSRLTANANLNTLKTPGDYYCNSGADAQTMTGIPPEITSNFRLIVFEGGSSNTYTQVIVGGVANPVFLYRGATSGDYGAWHKLVKADDVIPVTSGGTGATTAATARSNLGLSNKIIDSSSTNWVKFADGTAMCWGTLTLDGSSPTTEILYKKVHGTTSEYLVEFPFSFTAAPVVQMLVQNNSVVDPAFIGRIHRTTDGIRQVVTFRTTNSTTNIIIGWTAIGRWK